MPERETLPMISFDSVFRLLHLADPHPLTEAALRTQLSSSMGNRPIGDGELADALRRLEARRFAVASRNDDNDPLWQLTIDGRTEAKTRFR